MKFWLKITMPVIVIGIIGIGVGFVVNQYEDENNCTFSISVEHPFGACHPNRKYRDLCTPGEGCFFKPLILLYPLKKTDVTVRLTYVPGFFATFPEYSEQEKGWRVTAYPDGTLLDKKSGQETYGLFWKGNPGSDHFDISHGSVIKGSEIRDFLYTKLTEIGLNTKEKSDFISNLWVQNPVCFQADCNYSVKYR